MTRLLVEGGASLDAVDVNGNGVVHAAVCDSPAVLAILTDNGADVTVANHNGLTPKVGFFCGRGSLSVSFLPPPLSLIIFMYFVCMLCVENIIYLFFRTFPFPFSQRLCEQYCPPRLKERMLQLLKEATVAQAKADARREQLAEGQVGERIGGAGGG